MYGNSYINVEGHAEIPAGVDKIGQRAFMGIKQLKSVSIPNSVSAISWYAFSGCVSLTSITIPDTVKKIGKRCFECCDALTEVVLPDGIKEIGDETFFRCSSLQEVVIPDTVTSIGKGAFSQCSSLRKIVLPKNLKTIGEDAFHGCPLQEVSLPEGLERIGAHSFRYCSSLEALTIPESVKSIGLGAFDNCHKLKTLTLPKKMEELGNAAFCCCWALERIDVPEGITSIGPDVFFACEAAHVHLPSTLKEFCPDGNEWKTLSISPDNKVLTIEYNCLIDRNKRELLYVFPEATKLPENLKSIHLKDSAFPSFFDVEELIIPEGITHISSLPFHSMEKLKKLVLPKTMQSIGKGFLESYPFPAISVPPALLLSENFEPWQTVCRVDLIGVASVDEDLKIRIKNKFPINRWTERILSVYIDGQLIYPSESLLNTKVQAMEREKQSRELEHVEKERREREKKAEDKMLESMCESIIGSAGFKYIYFSSSEYTYFRTNPNIEVVVFNVLEIKLELQVETAQEDLEFLLDVAASFRKAMAEYADSTPAGSIRINYRGNWDRGMRSVSGQPIPGVSFHFRVTEKTAKKAFQALLNLEDAYDQLSQKYGNKVERLGFHEWLFYYV